MLASCSSSSARRRRHNSKLDFDAALGGDQFVAEVAGDLGFGFPGRLHPGGAASDDRSQQGRRAKLGVDQAVLQPGAATPASPIGGWAWPRNGRGRPGRWRPPLAVPDWFSPPWPFSRSSARSSSQLRRRALSLVARSCIERSSPRSAPTRCFGRAQRGGCLVEIGLGQTDGLRKLFHHALGLHVAQLLKPRAATA